MRFNEVLQRFTWIENGECFKCERSNITVTPIGVLEGSDGAVELSACHACTFRLENRLVAILDGSHKPTRRPLRFNATEEAHSNT